ncbi:MAG: class I SAM-dependent methyltransferase, partial [Acidobacteria bacterium]|nr:class I SAM-dependent methyltransferase [Acidobacteriota bacterium]
LMPAEHQEELVRALAAMLEPGGVLLVREVDAAAGFGFHLVRIGNCVKNVLVGNWRMRFHFRTASEWHSLFARHGLEVEIRPMGHGTPFANVFFRLQKGPP